MKEKLETINDVLGFIQSNLKANKGQFNAFGKYKYRSCEDVLEALKPMLKDTKSNIRIVDDIILVGDRYYIKATVVLTFNNQEITTTAFARESQNKKGMDEAQITGAASSYARKYALSGMFCIDDTKDADTANNSDSGNQNQTNKSDLSDKTWIIPFSKKFKGRPIGSVELIELQDFVTWLESSAASSGKEITGIALELVKRVEKLSGIRS